MSASGCRSMRSRGSGGKWVSDAMVAGLVDSPAISGGVTDWRLRSSQSSMMASDNNALIGLVDAVMGTPSMTVRTA